MSDWMKLCLTRMASLSGSTTCGRVSSPLHPDGDGRSAKSAARLGSCADHGIQPWRHVAWTYASSTKMNS
jgi:hypothetical protein